MAMALRMATRIETGQTCAECRQKEPRGFSRAAWRNGFREEAKLDAIGLRRVATFARDYADFFRTGSWTSDHFTRFAM